MRRSVIQLAVGLVLGLGLALLASGALQPILYRVDPRDVGVLGVVVATLALASLVASFLPARRVTRTSAINDGTHSMRDLCRWLWRLAPVASWGPQETFVSG